MKKFTSAERKRCIANGWVDSQGRPIGEDAWHDRDGAATDDDGNNLLTEIVSEEEFEAWRERGTELVRAAGMNQWAIGEWIVEGEDLKEMAGLMGADQQFKNSVYKAASAITGHSVQTIKSIAFVVRHTLELKDEFKELSFAHFKLVASPQIDLEKKRNLLGEMQRSKRNVMDSREMVRFQTGTVPEKRSRADKRALRLIAHCKHILAEMENYNLAAASPKLQEQVLDKVAATRLVLELEFAGFEVKALV